MMVLFFQAARLAMVVFDPLSVFTSAGGSATEVAGWHLIVDHHYYTFSSVFFYTDRPALMLNGRWNTMEYGSYASGAPNVFIDDSQFRDLWLKPQRYYIVAQDSAVPRLEALVGRVQLDPVAESGGKVLLTNHPLASSAPPGQLN